MLVHVHSSEIGVICAVRQRLQRYKFCIVIIIIIDIIGVVIAVGGEGGDGDEAVKGTAGDHAPQISRGRHVCLRQKKAVVKRI